MIRFGYQSKLDKAYHDYIRSNNLYEEFIRVVVIYDIKISYFFKLFKSLINLSYRYESF